MTSTQPMVRSRGVDHVTGAKATIDGILRNNDWQ